MAGEEQRGGPPTDSPEERSAGEELDWERLRILLRQAPEPEWDEQRAERIFQRVLQAVGRRQRRRRWALAAGAMAVPTALLVASRALRRTRF
jgi:hypothetical protein